MGDPREGLRQLRGPRKAWRRPNECNVVISVKGPVMR